MATVFFTDRIIRIESPEEVEELIKNPQQMLKKSGALTGLNEFNGFDPGDLKAMKYHDFRNGPLFCRHCESSQWIACGWSSVNKFDLVKTED